MKKKIQWNPSKSCNMRCSYCFNTLSEKKSKPVVLDTKKINKAFYREEPSIIVIGGGEPFMVGNFVEACEIITKKHNLIIVTNLSCEIDSFNFFNKVNPEKVIGISVSLHYSFRNNTHYEKLCSNIELLKKHNFPYRVSQVMTPEIIDKFYHIQDNFSSKIYPKVLEGSYMGKKYPSAYTEYERNKLLNIIKDVNKGENDVYMAEKILYGYSEDNEINFTGKICSSGFDDIVVVDDGTVFRCWNQHVPIGNFFNDPPVWWLDEPQECYFNRCSCPQMGFEDTEKYKLS